MIFYLTPHRFLWSRALVILTLIENKLPTSIRHVGSKFSSIYQHHFVLANLAVDSQLDNINTWNNDAILIDPLYGICMSASDIKYNKDFFTKYPLLSLYDKAIFMRIRGNTPSQSYRFAVRMFKHLRDEYKIKTDLPSHFDMIYPQLPKLKKF